MTEPKYPPVKVEILVDGETIHTFTAERLTTNETAQGLTLEADRWSPSVMHMPPNLNFPIESVSVDGRIVPPTGFGTIISSDVADELVQDFDPQWKIYGPGEMPPGCTICRHVLDEDGNGHARSCLTQLPESLPPKGEL